MKKTRLKQARVKPFAFCYRAIENCPLVKPFLVRENILVQKPLSIRTKIYMTVIIFLIMSMLTQYYASAGISGVAGYTVLDIYASITSNVAEANDCYERLLRVHKFRLTTL